MRTRRISNEDIWRNKEEKMNGDKKRELSRRDFLGGAAVLAASTAALGLAGCAPSQTSGGGVVTGGSGIPSTWDHETDVVVIGAGGAGHMAAIAAVESGSEAIMFEKMGSLMGDTAICACEMCGLWPDRTKADTGETDTVDQYMKDWEQSYIWSTRYYTTGEQYTGERVMTQREIELCPDTFQWLQDTAGVEWTTFYDSSWDPQPKWETVKPRNWKASNTRIIPPLAKLAASKGIETVFDVRASELIVNDDGRVIGARFTASDGTSVTAKARKAVVLSSGSFMGERTMVASYLSDLMYNAYGCSPGAAGDGHKLVCSIGGDWREMSLGARYAPVEMGSYSQLMMGSWYYCGVTKPQVPGIFINTEGKRFTAESQGYSFSAYQINKQPFKMAYYLVDSTAVAATHLLDGAEVSTTGGSSSSKVLLYQSDTLAGLAAKMNVDPDTLVSEVNRYNGFVDAGTDSDFNKVMTGTTRIETGPFYALAEICAPYNTYGGIKTDVDSHVIDTSGDAIAGLYAAGSCCGSYAEQEGLYYTGGVVQAMTFGRQAGQHAAAETAWE